MSLRKTIFVVSLVASVLCLGVGFAVIGQWLGVAVAIISGPGWLLARKYPDSGLPSIGLIYAVGVAVVGLLNGSQPMLMICGSGFALAAWDLLLLDCSLGKNPAYEKTHRYEQNHIQSLAIALVSGLVLVFAGRFLHLETPFILMLVFITLLIFGLVRVWGYIKNPG